MRSDLFALFFTTHYVSLCSLSAYLAAFAAIIVLGQGGAYGMDASHTMEMYVVMGLLTALAFFATEQILCGWQKAQRTVFILGKR